MLAECPLMVLRIKPARKDWPEWTVLGLVLVAWTVGCAAVLSHSLFVTNDSISNYAHVWYVAHVFWDGGGIPFHFPEIGHGDALAFPYAFVPWFSAALLRPIFGDWIVTLWLVVGAAGVTAGAFWAFPEIRKPLALALFLANPMLVEAVLLGQLPFLWATAFWFVAVGMWRGERVAWAVVFAALAQASHPAVLLPLAGLTVLVRLPFEANWRRLFVAYSLSVLLAVPAIALVFISPVVEDSTFVSLMGNFFGTISLRAFVVYAPFEIILLLRLFPRRTLFVAFAAVLSLNVVLVPIRHTGYAWHALTRSPDTTLLAFVDSNVFDKGATYRVLRVADGKVGMYQLLQHGARLDSEFFPESIDRRSWPAAPDYRDFLDRRDVDYVLIYRAYDARYHTNEHALLDELATGPCVSRVLSEPDFDVYRIDRTCH